MPAKPPGQSTRRKNIRKVQRLPFRLAGKLRLEQDADMAIRSVNMSIGGLGFVSPRMLPIGSQCTVAMEIRDKGRVIDLQANGRITYSVPSGIRNYRCGISFADNTDRTIAQIAQLTLLAPMAAS